MSEEHDELKPEYDMTKFLREGIRGKYAKRFWDSSNVVVLAPDVLKAFPDSNSVNEALRLVIQLSKIPCDADPEQ